MASRKSLLLIGILVLIPTTVSQNQCKYSLAATENPENFTSPGYPNTYPSLIECEWTIQTNSPSQVIVLKLLDFYLNGTLCTFDYVSIYDGHSRLSPRLNTLCGQNSDTQQFVSRDHIMTVTYHSDGRGSYNGFKFEYTSMQKPDVELLCNNSNLVATDNPSYLTSPNYPNNYSRNLDCQWNLTADSSSKVILLRLLDFQLEESTVSCNFDYVKIYDGNRTNFIPKQNLCGSVSSIEIISTGPYMTVTFHSDGAKNYKGFKFEYTSQNKSALCGNDALSATETAQYLTYFNYTNISNMDCQWTITAASSSNVVLLDILNLSLLSCGFDYVKIYDGYNTSFNEVQSLCGPVSTRQFMSTGRYLTVVFHSYGYRLQMNFKFEYTSQNKSDIVLSATETAKYITSPGYPSSYARNMDFQWHITAASSSNVILLKILDFLLEGTMPTCYFDFVKIYDGYNTSFNKVQSLCGQGSSRQIMSTGLYLTIVFHSDASNNNKGFKFEYTSQNKSVVDLFATGTANNFTSPGYPSSYESNTDSQWTIQAASLQQVVVLKMLDFFLEGTSPACNYDYVTIYDGSSTISPIKKKLCGQDTSTLVISTTDYMTVVFHSDGSNNYRGFQFQYTSSVKSDVCSGDNLTANTTASYLTSPKYPGLYPSNMDCQWTITAASPSSVILLKLLDFQLQGSTSACSYDYVTIYDGYDTSFNEVQSLCGQVSSRQIMSTGRYLTIVFHSDASNNNKGFKFEYTSQNKSGIDLLATGTAKYLTSSDYPFSYASNTNSQWTIRAASLQQVVVLKVLDFFLEGTSPDCNYDYVTIYDGSSTISPIIIKLCGQDTSTLFISTTDYMTVVFHSDGSSNYRGFQFQYTSSVKSDACSGDNLTANTTASYLTSPNYPGLYPNNMFCQCTITAASPSSVILLKLLDFQLQGSTSACSYDYVTIYDGYDTSFNEVRSLCGQVSSRQIMSTGRYLTVVFHSDSYINYKGFNFEYTSQNKSGIDLSATGTAKYLTSTGYPSSYASNTNSQWTIRAASLQQVVVLKMLDFFLEGTSPACYNDYVTIYDGSSTISPIIIKLCGLDTSTLFISTTDYMTVVFHSDGSSNYRGFQFQYTSSVKSDVCSGDNLTANTTASYLTSPNYPGLYPNNMDCQWTITAASPSSVILLKLLDFQLQGSTSACSYDYVTIYDGYNTSFNEVQSLCDQASSRQIMSTGRYLTVVFHSDSYINYKGFKFEYTSPSNSGADLSATGTAKYLTSPGYPSNYASNTNSQWTIRAASLQQVVVLKVLDFFLEGTSPDCTYDYVTIYDGRSTSFPISTQLCGQDTSTLFISTSDYMTVAFHSDVSSNYRGFQFQYTSSDKSDACSGENLTANTTVSYLTSPNYPGLYPSDIDCQWRITAASGSNVVVLELDKFSVGSYQTLCSRDYVKIYNGPSTASNPMSVLCGNVYYGKYESTGHDMTVVFHSDWRSSAYSGFRLTYKSQYSWKSNADYSQQDYTGTIVAVVTCGVAVPTLLVVIVICARRRIALRQIRNTQRRAPVQNGGRQNSLFIVSLLTNNPQPTPPPYFGTQETFDPPPYSSLDCNVNDNLPGYTPREPDYTADNLPPPYSCCLPGGTAEQGQTSPHTDSSLGKPADNVDSGGGAHLNLAFDSSNETNPTRGASMADPTDRPPCPPAYSVVSSSAPNAFQAY